MKTTFILLLFLCMLGSSTGNLFAWGLDIPIWAEGQVRCFDADYAADGTMFVVFQPEGRTEILFYESRNRGYSWTELFAFNCYQPIHKIKLVVHEQQKKLVVFFREPNSASQQFGNLVCFSFGWEAARTWTTPPAMVIQQVSQDQVIENSFDVCLGNNWYYAAWLEDVNASAKRLRVSKTTFSSLFNWTNCYNQSFTWTVGSGTRVSVDVNPQNKVCVGYCGYAATGFNLYFLHSLNGGATWESLIASYSGSAKRYDPHVAVANIDDLTAWTAFNVDRGDHEIGLFANCVTTRWLPSEIVIADSGNVDEYIADIENYRIFPNEYVNLLYIHDKEGAARTLYWVWSSAADPTNWPGKIAVNDQDITSWPEDVAPKLVYSPGNWAAGGGAIFSYTNQFGLFFDAPWNVTSANLLIVTTTQFRSAIQPLVDWKTQTGIRTYVLDFTTLTDGRDTAESIKKAIDRYYRNYGVRYVLLFGDSEIIPTRYTIQGYEKGDFFPEAFLDRAAWNWHWSAGDSITEAMLTFLPNYFATDLYYADLYDANGAFHTWDENSNGYFAEMYKNDLNPEHLHVFPEVAVGRVPASNVAEVENYVYKVTRYEPLAFQADWFNDTYTLANQDWSSWINASRKISDFMERAGFNDTHREHPNSTHLDSMIFVTGSSNGMGFLLYDGHGPWGMGDLDDWRVCNEKFPVVFHGGCGVGEFAPTNLLHKGFTGTSGIRYNGYQFERSGDGTNMPRNSSGNPPLPDPLQPADKDGSYPEFLICKNRDRGAIIYYGANTGMQSPGEDHGTWFFEAFTKGYRFAGDMWKYAVTTYIREHDIHSIAPGQSTTSVGLPGTATIWKWQPLAFFHQTFKYTLFGDPTLRVGGIPYDLSKTSVPVRSQSPVSDFVLLRNYPNPFNSGTMICFKVPEKTHAKLTIYNLQGQQVGQLLDQVVDAGEHQIRWQPAPLASGIYFYQVVVAGKTATNRLLYLK